MLETNGKDTIEVLKEFREFAGDSILVGHNVNFDINFIYDKFEKYLETPLSNDFIDTMKIMEVREQTVEKTYSVSSKDMQTISMTLNVQYSIGGDALELYSKFGVDYKDKLINPRISESLNAVSARYTIEEFITKRNEMAAELLKEVMADFDDYGIVVAACSIIEHDFSDEFDQAIERKLVASQNALTAQNDLEKVRYEAEAEVTKAKGIAEANRIMQESLTPLLIQRMYIEKWDGKMPQVSGSGVTPMIQVK